MHRAAFLQEQVARYVRLHVSKQKMTMTRFAELVEMDRPRLSRLLTGAQWASLVDLEVLLGACGATLTTISLAVGDGSHQSPRVRKVIASYLRHQLALVEEETAGSAPERP